MGVPTRSALLNVGAAVTVGPRSLVVCRAKRK